MPLFSKPNEQSTLEDELLYGMDVQILQEVNDSFIEVKTYYNYTGYARRKDFIESILPKQYIANISFLDILPTPEYRKQPILTLCQGSLISVIQNPTKDTAPFVTVVLQDGQIGYVVRKHIRPISSLEINTAYPQDILRERIVLDAMTYLNAPYRWGGKTHCGIDCSGLCSIAYLLNSIIIYRDAIFEKNSAYMRPISLQDIQPADLFFLKGHMCLYIGDDKYIHSSQLFSGVTINSLDPLDPLYREDIATEILFVGTVF